MLSLKRLLDVKNPLRWYRYLPAIILLFILVIGISAVICLFLYLIKDFINEIFGHNVVSVLYTGRQSFFTLFTVIITMIATMTALAGPALVLYWSFQQDQRTVINLSYQLIEEWRNERMTNALYNIGEYFNKHEADDNARYNLYLFSEIKENTDLRKSLTVLLNYMECVATACKSSHVNNQLIRSYFEVVFLSYYHKLFYYIKSKQNSKEQDKIRDFMTNDVYSDFIRLVESWKAENLSERKKI